MLWSAFLGALLALIISLPLAWKWGLGIRRVAFGVIALSVIPGLLVPYLGGFIRINAVVGTGLIWFMTLGLALVVLAYRFFRDPEREAPNHNDVIVSPADGEVLYVRESQGGALPVSTKHGRNYRLDELTKTPLRSEDAVIIGIGMSFLDVHVNRAPIAGRVTLQRHFPGSFGSLRLPEMVFQNERATTVIERDGLQVAMVQIASRLVRQIVAFVDQDAHVTLGQRIGMIRLGSQVDLVLPAREDLKITVQPGQRVTAGVSVIATLGRTGGHKSEAGEVAESQTEAGVAAYSTVHTIAEAWRNNLAVRSLVKRLLIR